MIRSNKNCIQKDVLLRINNFNLLLIKVALITAVIYGCKKEKAQNQETEDIISPIAGTRYEKTLDSIFLYAKQVYLWNEALPSYQDFNPRTRYLDSYGEFSSFRKELFDISQIKLNPATQKPYELYTSLTPKYSYIITGKSILKKAQAGPVFDDTILARATIHLEGKTIAYFAINNFPPLNNIQTRLNEMFEEFAVNEPKYLIIDLRNNRGGFVETAEYLANLIVSSKLNGKLMYTEQYNATLQNSKAIILRNQPYLNEMGKTVIHNGRIATMADVDYTERGNTYKFNKQGKLEAVEQIYFIVSGKTASASEMLISCLKPYYNIQIVGEKTYGKPVGFFGINIDQYTVFLCSFLIKNADGWYDYFDGIVPTINVKGADDPDIGNPEEICLKATLSAISGKSIIKPKVEKILSSKLSKDQDNGILIENRLKLNY